MTNQQPPLAPPRMQPYAPMHPVTQPTGVLSWTALGLALGAVFITLLGLLPGMPEVPLALPLGVAAAVVGILALRKRSRPRWPAIVALVLCALGIASFAVFAFWTLTQVGLLIWGQI